MRIEGLGDKDVEDSFPYLRSTHVSLRWSDPRGAFGGQITRDSLQAAGRGARGVVAPLRRRSRMRLMSVGSVERVS
jgi:hypothetical protein